MPIPVPTAPSQLSAVAAAEIAAGRRHVTGAGDQQTRQLRVGIDQTYCVPRMPKYIAGVIALRARRAVQVTTPNGPRRSNLRYGVPSQSPSGGRGVADGRL